MITAECGCQQGRLSLIGPRYAVDIWPELQSSGGAVIVAATTDATAAAVSELLGDRKRLDAMGPRGRAWVLDNLNIDRVLDSYEQLYRGAEAGAINTSC